jgi:hypothetical protein
MIRLIYAPLVQCFQFTDILIDYRNMLKKGQDTELHHLVINIWPVNMQVGSL